MTRGKKDLAGITQIGNPGMKLARASGGFGTEVTIRKDRENVLTAASPDTGAGIEKSRLENEAGVRGRHNRGRDQLRPLEKM